MTFTTYFDHFDDFYDKPQNLDLDFLWHLLEIYES